MTSRPLTTEITVAEPEADEEPGVQVVADEGQVAAAFSDDSLSVSDSDSDEDFEDDGRYDVKGHEEVSDEVLTQMKDLLNKDHFYKKELICYKKEDTTNVHKFVSLLTLSDNKITENDKNLKFTDSDNKYVFESKDVVLSRLKTTKSKASKPKQKVKDVQINRIPKTFPEFLQILFDLNAVLIEDQRCKLYFTEETQMRESRLQSHDSYVNAMIPFIMKEFWEELKNSRKRAIDSMSPSFHMICDKVEGSSNEVNCSHIQSKESRKTFRFGQIVILTYTSKDANDNSDNGENGQDNDKDKELNEVKRFGVVIHDSLEVVDKNSELLDKPLLKLQANGQSEDCLVLETLNIYTNCFDETFDSVTVLPLTCVQKYLLESRIVYELKEPNHNHIFQQILKPNYKNLMAGISVNLERRSDLFDVQKDAIQKAYEVSYFPEFKDCSSFAAIYGKRGTGKTEILIETALQLVKYADEKVEPIIVVAMDQELTQIIHCLKKEEIKVFHISSDGINNCLSHQRSDFRRYIKKSNKKKAFGDIDDECFARCLKYYGEDYQSVELNSKEFHLKETIEHMSITKILSEVQVIVGSIKDIMNDERFNSYFNNNESHQKMTIKSALIDSAHLLTETELLTLLFSGVKSFVLCGDSYMSAVSYQKSESYFKRYITTFCRNIRKDPKEYSVVNLKETIDSLKRMALNKNRSEKFRQNNSFQNKFNSFHNNDKSQKPNNKFDAFNRYDRNQTNRNRATKQFQKPTSNYGSSFFDRFKNKKPLKDENSGNQLPKEANPNQPSNDFNANPQQMGATAFLSQGPNMLPNYDPRQVSNPMITGIAGPSFGIPGVGAPTSTAYGNRASYIEHNRNRYFQSYGEPYGNASGQSSACTQNSDPNSSGFDQRAQRFVSNPTRHHNHNLF